MMQEMMQGMMGYGFGGWLMSGTGLLLFVVLILAAAALLKYLFFADRGDDFFADRGDGGRRGP